MGLPGLSLSEGTQDPILPNQPCSKPCVRLSIVFFTSHKLLGPLLKELSELYKRPLHALYLKELPGQRNRC